MLNRTTLMLDSEVLDRVDELAAKRANAFAVPSRSATVRDLLRRALASIGREVGEGDAALLTAGEELQADLRELASSTTLPADIEK